MAGGRASGLVGGSREGVKDEPGLVRAGLRWFENPGTGRDLARWLRHDIDTATESGHGFALGDIDGDGDLDLVANCEEYNRLRTIIEVVWSESPGSWR